MKKESVRVQSHNVRQGRRCNLGRYAKQLVLITFVTFAINARAQTLNDYLQQAAQNNPGLKASYAEYEAALQRIAQARGLPNPTFRVSAFGEMVETRVGQQMASLSIEQDFPWFGTLKARGDEAALMAEASLKRFQEARNELFYRVKSAYYPIYEVDQLVKLQTENLSILETYKSLSTVRFQNGKAPMVDVVRINIVIDQIQTQIRILEGKRGALETTFNALLNREDEEPIVVPDTVMMPEVSPEIWEDSLQNNPRLSAKERMTEAATARELIARKESMPAIGLGFSYIAINRRPDMDFQGNGKDAYMPMFSVSLPIYRKKYRSAISEAQFTQAYYKSSKEDEMNKLKGDFAMAKFEIENGKEQYRMFHHHIDLTQQAIRLLLSAVENSGQDFEEVLRMQQELLTYQSERVKVVAATWIAVAKLEYLTASSIAFN
jgi:outer membrane protein, heavy metal efflux system